MDRGKIVPLITVLGAALIAALIPSCLPTKYPLKEGSYKRVVLDYKALHEVYRAYGGTKEEIYGFTLIPKDGSLHDFSKGPCIYYIRKDRVGTSTENHEQHHCWAGKFHK